MGIAGRKEALLPVLIVLTACCCSLNLPDAALASLLGLVVLALVETTFNFLISAVSGIAVRQAIEDPLLRLLFLLPEFAYLTSAIFILRHYNLALFDIRELKSLERLKGERGYRFIRWVDGILSFRDQGGDSGGLEGSDSR